MCTGACFLGGEVLRPSVTPSWPETLRRGSQSWKFCHTSKSSLNASVKSYLLLCFNCFSFDTGRVLAQRAIDIHPEQTREELAAAMGTMGAELMMKVLENLEQSWDRALEQDETLVTYGKDYTFTMTFTSSFLLLQQSECES